MTIFPRRLLLLLKPVRAALADSRTRCNDGFTPSFLLLSGV